MNHGQDDQHTQDSAISGLSLLEDDTDEFYQKSMEHLQRDKKRAQDAIAGGAQAFRRARPDHRVALTMETLERREGKGDAYPISRAQNTVHRRTASAGDSLASPNVPRQWGRKGKLQKNAFLGRINSSMSSDSGDMKERRQDSDAIYPYKTLFTGDSPDQSFDTAEVAVPSVEQGSPRRARTSKRSSYTSRSGNDPFRQIIHLENGKLPDDSPIPLRSQRRRESEGVRFEEEKMEASDQEVEGKLKPRTLSRASSYGQVVSTSQSMQTSREQGPAERTLHPYPDTVWIEGQVVREPPSGGVGRGRSSSQATRPDLKRLSSRDLLRQLARASSSPSPSPRNLNSAPHNPGGSEVSRADDVKSERQHAGIDAAANASKARDSSTFLTPSLEKKRASRRESTSPKRALRAAGADFKTSTAKGTLSPSSKSNKHLTKKLAAENTTTGTSRDVQQSSHTGSTLKALIRNSAGTTRFATRSSRDSDEIGNAAVTSLQEFVANGDPEHTQSLLAMDDDTLELVANVGTPMQFSSKERREEQLTLQRMAQNLRAVRRSVRDATRGITRVEQEVETAEKSTGNRASTHCEHCQNRSTNSPTLWVVLMATFHSFLRKCYFYNAMDGRIRFTWLGMFIIAMCAWLVSEYSLWYAGYMIGTGVNIYAPVKPFVTFTILVQRPTRVLWRPALHALGLLYGVIWRLTGGPEREARKPSFFFLNMIDRPPYDRIRVDKDAEGKLTFWYNLFDWYIPEGEDSLESRISRMVATGMATPVKPEMTRQEWWRRRAARIDTQLRPTGAAGFPPETANTPVEGQLRQQELSNDDAMRFEDM